jgi:hypothetical protein
MRNVGNIWFVSFCALGVAWGVEMRPIEKREGEGALAFDGHRLNNKYNNQPKVGIRGGGDIWEGMRSWWNVWGERHPIVLGGKSGNKISKEKLIHCGLWGQLTTKNKQQPTKNTLVR